MKTPIEDWVKQNRIYKATSGLPGPRDVGVTPYIRALHSFADNVSSVNRQYARFVKYETCVLVCGTQMGKTDVMLDIIGWRLAVRPRPQLYAGPSSDFVRDQFEPRLDDLLKDSRGIRYDILKSKKILKYANGTKVRLGWGGSAASLASDQAADIYVDEYDKMFRAQRKSGDPYNLAKARGDTYADRKVFVTSTPEAGIVTASKDPKSNLEFWDIADVEKVESHVWRMWQTGTRHHFAWKCPHCNEWFIPRFSLLKWPKGASAGVARRKTYMQCPSENGCVIEEHEKEALNATGQFVAPGEWFDENDLIQGEPIDTDMLTLQVSGLASPFIGWGERAADWITASNVGEEESKQAAMNNCGEVWSPIAVKQVSADEVNAKCVDYHIGTVPRQILRITCGVDVQKNRLVCVVRGWGPMARSYLLDATEIFGLTSETKVWSELLLYLQRTYGGLRVEKTMIDAGFRPDKRDAGDYHKVLDFTRRNSWLVTATRGKATQSVPIFSRTEEVTAEGKSEKYGVEVVSINTDFFKSLWFSRLQTPPNDPNSVHFPINVDQISAGDYAKQIVSEIRGDDGLWHQIYRQNHYLDAEVLASVAAYMLKVQDISEGSYRKNDDYEIVRSEELKPAAEVKKTANRFADMSAKFNRKK